MPASSPRATLLALYVPGSCGWETPVQNDSPMINSLKTATFCIDHAVL
jgi:hypothetical protein